jgi:hypothetical protein
VTSLILNHSLLFHRALHLPEGTPVEDSVDINVPGESLLASPLGATADRNVKSSLRGSELLGEETAVSTEADAALLEEGSLELDGTSIAKAEHR